MLITSRYEHDISWLIKTIYKTLSKAESDISVFQNIHIKGTNSKRFSQGNKLKQLQLISALWLFKKYLVKHPRQKIYTIFNKIESFGKKYRYKINLKGTFYYIVPRRKKEANPLAST